MKPNETRWWHKHAQARRARLRRLKMGLPVLHPYPVQQVVWNRIKPT